MYCDSYPDPGVQELDQKPVIRLRLRLRLISYEANGRELGCDIIVLRSTSSNPTLARVRVKEPNQAVQAVEEGAQMWFIPFKREDR